MSVSRWCIGVAMAKPPQSLVASPLGSEDVTFQSAVEAVGTPVSPADARRAAASVSRRAVVRPNAAAPTEAACAREDSAGTSAAAERRT